MGAGAAEALDSRCTGGTTAGVTVAVAAVDSRCTGGTTTAGVTVAVGAVSGADGSDLGVDMGAVVASALPVLTAGVATDVTLALGAGALSAAGVAADEEETLGVLVQAGTVSAGGVAGGGGVTTGVLPSTATTWVGVGVVCASAYWGTSSPPTEM